MVGEVSVKVSRYNRDYIESFGGATHDDSFTRVVDLVDRLYPGISGIDYLIKLIVADIMGDIPDTSDMSDTKKKEILFKMQEAKTLIQRHEINISTHEARKRFAEVSGGFVDA